MAQTLVSLLVHVVFSTKNRADLITPEIEPDMFAYVGAILKHHESRGLAAGGTANHVHLLVSLSKNIALSSLVAEVKKNTSKWIKTKGRQFVNFGWQDGYGAFTVGQSNVAALRRYIAGQKEHHRERSFECELKTLLERYGIAYDERYLWR